MRLIHYIVFAVLLFFASNILKAEDLTKDDFKVAKRYGYSAKDIRLSYQEKSNAVNKDKILASVAYALENDGLKSAEYYDEAIANLLNKADVILRAEGNYDLADEIQLEYMLVYKGAVMRQFLGLKEIGDHPPLSEWLDTVHDKIHDTIGDFLCKQFHFHDIMILNYGLPVVFSPKQYKQKDYLDHFAGHLIWGWFWEHHGVAGVITYWVTDGICIGATYGLGIVTFVCGPIASLAENVMDKRIAPTVGERIWKRSQQGN
jgi:hypothetical protein